MSVTESNEEDVSTIESDNNLKLTLDNLSGPRLVLFIITFMLMV